MSNYYTSRGYDQYGRQVATVEVGAEYVTVRQPSGKTQVARILDNKDGKVLCDRLVHEKHVTYAGYEAEGCWVTEFTRKEKDDGGDAG